MDWITLSLKQMQGVILSTVLIYVGLLIIIKINGLRSFSKMSAHDFAVTIAIGSIIASASLSKQPSVLQAMLAIGTFITLQSLYSHWRIKRSNSYLENEPLLLMDNGTILHDNLHKASITENDLIGKLREANVLQLSEVRAAVFEPTGDVSILHGDASLDDILLQDVRRK